MKHRCMFYPKSFSQKNQIWHIGTEDSAEKQERRVCQRAGLKYFGVSSEFSALRLLATTNH